MGALVSVVIPVYNVEEYLVKCINSIIAQTYSHIEVILVDDGSTDRSGEICDKYAGIDKRVKVIHQENKGLSAARNIGIDTAIGEYLLFVDSDDYVSQDHIGSLLQQAIANKADIVMCELLCINRRGECISSPVNNGEVIILNTKTALYELLKGTFISTSACGKLYSKKLFSQIRFPEGRIYEDIGTVYKTILLCEKIVLEKKASYFYLYRDRSIAHEGFSSKTMDAMYMTEEMVKEIVSYFPELVDVSRCNLFGICTSLLSQMDKRMDIEFYCQVKKRIVYLRGSVLFCSKARLKHRIFAAISFLGIDLLYLFMKQIFTPIKNKVKPSIS